MTQTIMLYCAVLSLCFFLAKKARKNEKKINIVIIVFLLTMLAGMRKYTVGIDTGTYVYYLDLIRNGQFNDVWGVERTFKIIMLLLSRLSGGYTLFLTAMALITNACIVIRFWDFRDIAKFEWMLLAYYIMFYFYGYNIMRQMCAVAIVFWSSRYIEKENYLSFLMGIAIAYFFHTSAILGLCYLLAEFVNWRYLDIRKKRVIRASMLLFPVGAVYAVRILFSYLGYFSNLKIRLGPILFAKLMFFLISQYGLKNSIVYREEKKQQTGDRDAAINICYKIQSIEICYLAGLLLAFLGYANQTISRGSLYLYIMECVYMGILMQYKKISSIYPLLVFLLYSYLFVSTLIAGGQGEIPYLFFWQ